MKVRLVSIAAAGALAAAAMSVAPAQAGTRPRAGCPGGAVCMYTTAGEQRGKPEHIFTTYGFHALHQEFGRRTILNNQFATSAGRAAAYTCKSTDPSTCHLITMDTYFSLDISPINYIRLTATGG